MGVFESFPLRSREHRAARRAARRVAFTGARHLSNV